MFIYIHWPKNDQYSAYAFHKFDKAAEVILDHLRSYIGMTPKPKYKITAGDLYPQEPPQPPRGRIRPAAMPALARPVVPAPPPPAAAEMFDAAPAPVLVNDDIFAAVAIKKEYDVITLNEPEELVLLKDFLSKDDKTFDGVLKAIFLYEEYAKYVLMQESSIHELKEVNVSE